MQQPPIEPSTTLSFTPHSHSRSSGSSAGSVSAPRPTLADIDLPPRRRLRDGTRSTAASNSGSASASGSGSASGSRASSVSSTHSRGRSNCSRGSARGRGRSVSSFSTVSSNGISTTGTMPINMPNQSRTTSVRPRGTGSGTGVRRSPRTRRTSIPDLDSIAGDFITPFDVDQRHQTTPPVAESGSGSELGMGTEHPSTLIEMLDAIDTNRTRDTFERTSDGAGEHDGPSASSSSTSTPLHHNETQVESDRRFTAAEKGKGRALPGGRSRARARGGGGAGAGNGGEAITISEDEEGDGDDVIQVTGVKRRIHALEDDELEEEGYGSLIDGDGQLVDGDGDIGDVVEVVPVDEGLEVEDGLKEFTCPVCFCEPTQAVITVCGHVLCAECLHSSLLAAIARNPNPYPHNHPPRQRPKPKKRGGGIKKLKEAQPTEWTADTLIESWTLAREKEYELKARAAGMDEASLEAGRNESTVEVVHVLKGLWKVDGRYWVIEGECPVCRKGIPGGYGPPGKGVGGVAPVLTRVGSGWGMNRS